MTRVIPLVVMLLALAGSSRDVLADDTAASSDAAAPPDSVQLADDRAPPPPRVFCWSLDFTLGGGSVVGFADGMTTGHSFWGGVWFNWSDFGAGIVGFGAYPDSRVQTRFGGLLLDFRWYFLGEVTALRPYASIALGFSGADSLDGRTNVVDPVRWSADGSPLIVAPSVGLRWGADEGLFVLGEVRLLNVSHVALSLGAGFSF